MSGGIWADQWWAVQDCTTRQPSWTPTSWHSVKKRAGANWLSTSCHSSTISTGWFMFWWALKPDDEGEGPACTVDDQTLWSWCWNTGPAGEDDHSATLDAISSGRTLDSPQTQRRVSFWKHLACFKRISWSQRSSHSTIVQNFMEHEDKPEWTRFFFLFCFKFCGDL